MLRRSIIFFIINVCRTYIKLCYRHRPQLITHACSTQLICSISIECLACWLALELALLGWLCQSWPNWPSNWSSWRQLTLSSRCHCSLTRLGRQRSRGYSSCRRSWSLRARPRSSGRAGPGRPSRQSACSCTFWTFFRDVFSMYTQK